LRLIRVIGQVPPEQIHRARPAIADLDPILVVAILVHDRVRVACEKLGNDQLRPQRQSEKDQGKKNAR
jgi:hypothetical protein